MSEEFKKPTDEELLDSSEQTEDALNDDLEGVDQSEVDVEQQKPEVDDSQPDPVDAASSEQVTSAKVEDGSGSEQSEESSAEKTAVDEKQWYVLKVQVNREDSIRDGLVRRIAMHGLDDYFGEVLVPAEKVTEVRGGKKRTVRRKLLPGYIIVQMVINDDTWFLVRETAGIGDFTGAIGKPIPMEPYEVQRLLASQQQEEEKQEAKIKITFVVGDRVKITEGTFENFEGEVQQIDDTNGIVWVMINIFGRSTPVRFEYWQIENIE